MTETFLKGQQAFSEDGWQRANETWTYASASTITVPSGAASRYQKGDRVKWTQTTVKYGVIVTVADTLLTIAVNTDYTVANAAITANYYSHQANPLGYPTWFTYTPNFNTGSFDNGSGGQPTISNARLRIDGSMFTSHIKCNGLKVYGDALISLYHHLALANTSARGILGQCYSYIGTTHYFIPFWDLDGTNHYIMYTGTIADNTVIADLSIWYQHEF